MSLIANKVENFFSLFNGEFGKEEDIRINKTKRKIMGFFGTQGGTGVSSLIVQTSQFLRKMGYRVLVIDGNLLTPYYYCLYTPKKNNITLKDYILNGCADDPSNLLCVDKNGISYLYIEPFTLIELLQFNDSKDTFDKVRKVLHEIYKYFDIVIIDLNVQLSTQFIEQAFIKELQCLVQLRVNSLASKLNNYFAKSIFKYTMSEDIPRLKILNKAINETYNEEVGLLLPYKEKFPEYEKKGTYYLYSEDNTKDDYIAKFSIYIQEILNMLNADEEKKQLDMIKQEVENIELMKKSEDPVKRDILDEDVNVSKIEDIEVKNTDE